MRCKHPIGIIFTALALVVATGAIFTSGPAMAAGEGHQHGMVPISGDPLQGKRAVKLDELGDALGVELVAVRRTAAGHILDLRYRITDREKARPMVEGKMRPYLVDPERKLTMQVPSAEKIGQLRQLHLSQRPDFVYFMLFSNIGRSVRAGDRVTVVFGDLRIDDILVEG